MFIHFLFLSFGLVFTHRMIHHHLNRKTLSEATSMAIAKIHVIWFWLLALLSPWIPVLFLLFLLFVPGLAATRLDGIINFILRHRFRRNLIEFTDELILLMMTGKSFRDSFLQLTTNQRNFFQAKMRELLAVSRTNSPSLPQESHDLGRISQLVQTIEKNPHKAIDKLKGFRRQLHWNIVFEQKARQATTQIRAQAAILCLLYLVLLAYIVRQHGSRVNSVVIPSVLLFMSGLITILLMKRKKKWKT